MFQILSFKRVGASPAQSGPGSVGIPVGNADTPDLGTDPEVSRARRDALYAEAIRLADQARSWFDGPGKRWRKTLPPLAQAAVASENLAINARLTAAIAWLSSPESSRNHPETVPELPANHPLKPTIGGQISDATRVLLANIAKNS